MSVHAVIVYLFASVHPGVLRVARQFLLVSGVSLSRVSMLTFPGIILFVRVVGVLRSVFSSSL